MSIPISIARGAVLLVATTNAGKLREIQSMLAGVPLEVRRLPDEGTEGAVAAPEETGRTFAENARLKARYYASATGLLTVAEDSGLEIDALDGAPGVWSARYPGDSYEERFRNLFAELAARGAIDPSRRTARFVSALALAVPRAAGAVSARRTAGGAAAAGAAGGGGAVGTAGAVDGADAVATASAAAGDDILFEARGTVEGLIAPAPRGANGFGYDPIFWYPPYGRTLAEVTDEEKDRVSHRGASFRELRAFLEHHVAR